MRLTRPILPKPKKKNGETLLGSAAEDLRKNHGGAWPPI
jgi:hypothetical protein